MEEAVVQKEEVLYHDVVEHSIESFTAEVVRLTKDGWEVSRSNPGDAVGFGQTYTVSMYRDKDTILAFKQLAGDVVEKPKLTRSEILANARAAKAGKASGASAVLDLEKVV